MWRFKKHGTPPEPANQGMLRAINILVPLGPNSSATHYYPLPIRSCGGIAVQRRNGDHSDNRDNRNRTQGRSLVAASVIWSKVNSL